MLRKTIAEILQHRLAEIGYNDKEDPIVEACLDAIPELKDEYTWEES